MWAPQKKWWHSAHITVADGARNLNPRLCRDRSLLPVCSLSPSPFLFLYLFDIWLAGRDGWKPPFRVGHFWDSLGFDIQRPITTSQSTWADLSYPLLTECTFIQVLQMRAFGKCSSRCFHRLLPLWSYRRENRLIDCWRGNTALVLSVNIKTSHCAAEDT